jgi:hypothetical protein
LRVEDGDEIGSLVGEVAGGAGLSYGLGTQGIWSTTLDAGITGGEDCDDTCSVNIGPAMALLWPMSDRATLAASAGYRLRVGERVRDAYALRLGQSYGVTANLAIKLELALEDEGGGLQPELLSTLNWYF